MSRSRRLLTSPHRWRSDREGNLTRHRIWRRQMSRTSESALRERPVENQGSSVVSRLKSLTPASLEPAALYAWFLARPIVRVAFAGSRRYCPVCSSRTRYFLAHSSGQGKRADIVCPVCLCHDRHRLAWLFLKSFPDLNDGLPKRFLHFAPEPEFVRRFKHLPGIQYASADWASPHAMTRMDITQIGFADGSFDAIYCSHVLEHVVQDRRAMQELFRVLAPGGWALIQIPIGAEKTTEYPASKISNGQNPWKAGHVRRYGLDVRNRFTDAGFEVQTIFSEQLASPEDSQVMSLLRGEPLFLCRKRI